MLQLYSNIKGGWGVGITVKVNQRFAIEDNRVKSDFFD